MSKIVAIGTAVPAFGHAQMEILNFMQAVYCFNETDRRKLRFLYQQSGIKQRYSVVPDYSSGIDGWTFYPQTENLEPFPTLEQRMALFNREAPPLSVAAIQDCVKGIADVDSITHLITVTCTGLSAPGLDLQVMELLQLPRNLVRTSVNFMGCYAAIHALKLADAFCKADASARVLIVCTELCTLHFQRDASPDSVTSSLLFGDGSAAALITSDSSGLSGLHLENFYAEVAPKGRQDMAWELSASGFLMTLSGYVPQLLEEDFSAIVQRSLQQSGRDLNAVSGWCIHPGGRRILEAIQKSVGLDASALVASYQVLQEYGNMSSATLLFVLKKLMQNGNTSGIFGAAFGPGLTIETFTATSEAH